MAVKVSEPSTAWTLAIFLIGVLGCLVVTVLVLTLSEYREAPARRTVPSAYAYSLQDRHALEGP